MSIRTLAKERFDPENVGSAFWTQHWKVKSTRAPFSELDDWTRCAKSHTEYRVARVVPIDDELAWT